MGIMEMLTKPKAPWAQFYPEGSMDIDVPNKTVYKYFEEKAEQFGKKICLDYYGTKVRYNELLYKIDVCAKGLYDDGIRKGDVVTICLPNTLEGVIAFFAINKIGGVVNLIHPASSENEIRDSINETNSKVIFLIDTNYLKLKSIEKDINIYRVILVNPCGYMPFITKIRHSIENKMKPKDKNSIYRYWNIFLLRAKKLKYDNYISEGTKNDPSIILHSGGTTGTPKGVVLTNGNLNYFVESATICHDYLKENDTCFALMPIFHGFGLVHSILYPLCIGMNVILRPRFDVKEYCRMIVKYKPQILMGVPSLFESIVTEWKNKKIDLSFVKCVMIGGDVLKPDLRKKLNSFLRKNNASIKAIDGYGLSEAVCGVAIGKVELPKEGTIPMPGVYVGIFSENDEELPYGEEGEICVYGPTVMQGYYKNKEETKIALHTHKDKRIWLHTGDLGSMDEDGILTYCSRLKRMIISSGYNVYPNRIEKLIETHPSVSACIVVGVPHKHKMEVPKAYIVLKNKNISKNALKLEFKKMCKKNLPKYSWPYEYEFLDEMPKTKVGKVDFNRLQKGNLKEENEEK